MKVFLNAVSLKEAGSLAILKRLIPAMISERPDISWVAALNHRVGTFDAPPGQVDYVALPDQSPAQALRWYEWTLPAAARRAGASVVFSVTNLLPHRVLSAPTVLLEHHAGHFSDEFGRLVREGSPGVFDRLMWRERTRWIRRSVERTDVLVVQTSALADAIAAQTHRRRSDIRVIPHGPGWVEQAAPGRPARRGGSWRIGYVASRGVQKNFETLIKAASALHAEGWPVTLVLTLDPGWPEARDAFVAARAAGIETIVENHASVDGCVMTALYDSLDVFVFPSLCESFGLPMVEAMARGLPIVVADTPENREVTGAAGVPFPPRDAAALAARIAALLGDEQERAARSSLSLARGRDFSWRSAASQTIAALEEAASR